MRERARNDEPGLLSRIDPIVVDGSLGEECILWVEELIPKLEPVIGWI